MQNWRIRIRINLYQGNKKFLARVRSYQLTIVQKKIKKMKRHIIDGYATAIPRKLKDGSSGVVLWCMDHHANTNNRDTVILLTRQWGRDKWGAGETTKHDVDISWFPAICNVRQAKTEQIWICRETSTKTNLDSFKFNITAYSFTNTGHEGTWLFC